MLAAAVLAVLTFSACGKDGTDTPTQTTTVTTSSSTPETAGTVMTTTTQTTTEATTETVATATAEPTGYEKMIGKWEFVHGEGDGGEMTAEDEQCFLTFYDDMTADFVQTRMFDDEPITTKEAGLEVHLLDKPLYENDSYENWSVQIMTGEHMTEYYAGFTTDGALKFMMLTQYPDGEGSYLFLADYKKAK